MDQSFISRAISDYFVPNENDYSTGFMHGRFNPLGNHHTATVDYLAEEYNVEKVRVGVVDSANSAKNPLSTGEVIESIEKTFDELETDYEVDPIVHEINSLDDLMWGNIDLNNETLYYTGDPDKAFYAAANKIRSDGDFGIAYDSRHAQDLEMDAELPESATDIKDAMKNEGEWRQYVSEATESIIDRNPEIKQRMQEGSPRDRGKHWEVLTGSSL